MFRALRRWRPALLFIALAMGLLAIIALVVVAVVVPRPSPYVGTWLLNGQRALVVSQPAGRLALDFGKDGRGWTSEVPRPGDLTTPADIPAAVASGSNGATGSDRARVLLVISDDGDHLTLTAPVSMTAWRATYSRDRSGFPWFGTLVIGGAFVTLTLAFYLARSRSGMSRKEKVSLGLLVAGGLLTAVGVVVARPALMWFAAGPLAACWYLIVLRVIGGEIPDIAVGAGLVTSRARRSEYRELLAAMDEQSRRGEALTDVLDRFTEERGDATDSSGKER